MKVKAIIEGCLNSPVFGVLTDSHFCFTFNIRRDNNEKDVFNRIN